MAVRNREGAEWRDAHGTCQRRLHFKRSSAPEGFTRHEHASDYADIHSALRLSDGAKLLDPTAEKCESVEPEGEHARG